MKKVAVFGNAGSGKSTLARSVAALTELPLDPLDTISRNDSAAAETKSRAGQTPDYERRRDRQTSFPVRPHAFASTDGQY